MCWNPLQNNVLSRIHQAQYAFAVKIAIWCKYSCIQISIMYNSFNTFLHCLYALSLNCTDDLICVRESMRSQVTAHLQQSRAMFSHIALQSYWTINSTSFWSKCCNASSNNTILQLHTGKQKYQFHAIRKKRKNKMNVIITYVLSFWQCQIVMRLDFI